MSERNHCIIINPLLSTKRPLRDDHVAKVLNNFAVLLNAKEDHDGGIRLIREALVISKKTYGHSKLLRNKGVFRS